MITSATWCGKRFAVLGLARSGAATVAALLASGAEVVAWDSDENARNLHAHPALTIGDPLAHDLSGFSAVVVSPGVPLNRHPIVAYAKRFNAPLIGDIELFAQARAELPSHKVVGITGTNGKSTTTALIRHICETACVTSLMGGNIGLPILAQETLKAGGVYILELSSYQLDLTVTLNCDVAVLLNITPDHLDRYDGFASYAASKARLFTMQSADRDAVICLSDNASYEVSVKANARVTQIAAGGCMDQSRWPALQGPHNAQNALAAATVARLLGITEAAIERGLATFPGLPHRMERVRTLRDVLYVNDSKATNPTATAPALAAYPAIHWILGGRAKTAELDACLPFIEHVRGAYTIGEAGPMLANLLTPYTRVNPSGTLENAIMQAAAAAQPGETVLLSPACASFDQFADFAARGDAFRQYVEGLS